MPYRARVLAISVAFATLLSLGAVPGAKPETAAASAPKVAVIVGPTDITDSHYLKWAEELKATAEAAGATVDLRYCATPAEAKAAANGANVIVYFGHGNGFPNPYSATKLTDRTNGWGLRHPTKPWSAKSCRDDVLQYYGEDHLTGKIDTFGWGPGGITPAPNFVMVYSNACYAPGAGEARPAPDESVAVSRVANYSNPILELGGTYFATDLGSRQLVDLILRNPSTSFAEIFQSAPGYSASALRTHPHPLHDGKKLWVQKTNSQWLGGEDYWFAFSGEPYRAPNGTSVLYRDTFSDIWESPFRDNIVWIAGSGITAGCSPARYCPRSTVTREQMASFLVRALKLPPTNTDYFTDDTGSPHESDINRLAASGITGGCGPGRFCPRETITREQMAAFLHRAFKK